MVDVHDVYALHAAKGLVAVGWVHAIPPPPSPPTARGGDAAPSSPALAAPPPDALSGEAAHTQAAFQVALPEAAAVLLWPGRGGRAWRRCKRAPSGMWGAPVRSGGGRGGTRALYAACGGGRPRAAVPLPVARAAGRPLWGLVRLCIRGNQPTDVCGCGLLWVLSIAFRSTATRSPTGWCLRAGVRTSTRRCSTMGSRPWPCLQTTWSSTTTRCRPSRCVAAAPPPRLRPSAAALCAAAARAHAHAGWLPPAALPLTPPRPGFRPRARPPTTRVAPPRVMRTGRRRGRPSPALRVGRAPAAAKLTLMRRAHPPPTRPSHPIPDCFLLRRVCVLPAVAAGACPPASRPSARCRP